jgi:hypothetical protein
MVARILDTFDKDYRKASRIYYFHVTRSAATTHVAVAIAESKQTVQKL